MYNGANPLNRSSNFENRKNPPQISNAPSQFANLRMPSKESQDSRNYQTQNNNPMATHSFTLS
jgi:hypothetical protein